MVIRSQVSEFKEVRDLYTTDLYFSLVVKACQRQHGIFGDFLLQDGFLFWRAALSILVRDTF